MAAPVFRSFLRSSSICSAAREARVASLEMIGSHRRLCLRKLRPASRRILRYDHEIRHNELEGRGKCEEEDFNRVLVVFLLIMYGLVFNNSYAYPFSLVLMRSPAVLGCCIESFLPMHNATATALMTSMLSVSMRGYGWLSEGIYSPSIGAFVLLMLTLVVALIFKLMHSISLA